MIFNKYFIIAIVALLLICFTMFKLWRKAVQNSNRLAANQTELLGQVKYYYMQDSSQVAEIGALTLTFREMKNAQSVQIEKMRESLQELNIRLKDVQAYSTANTTTTNYINTFLTDSLILDSIPVKYFTMKNRWYDVNIQVYPDNDDSLSASIITYDVMEQIVHKLPRGIKFWKRSFWKPRKLRQSIHFSNPDTRITYPNYITVRK